MQLKTVRITDFRSIRDSNEFDVTEVTGLVGKNESGKTAILQALYRLNPIVPEHDKLDVTDDYPVLTLRITVRVSRAAQALFVGPNCLVVEGPSDLLYLQVISALLREKNRTPLSEEWTLTPVGGSDKVPTFVALLGAQRGLKVATLIDVQNKDRQKIENLYKSKLLKQMYVITFADFTGKSEADIEDMFDLSFYLKIFNAEYAKALDAPLKESDMNLQGRRILVAIEEDLVKQPLKKNERFSHYRPARYLFENAATLAAEISAETLNRFEKAFKTVNALL